MIVEGALSASTEKKKGVKAMTVGPYLQYAGAVEVAAPAAAA